jgi:hypothetical protein
MNECPGEDDAGAVYLCGDVGHAMIQHGSGQEDGGGKTTCCELWTSSNSREKKEFLLRS